MGRGLRVTGTKSGRSPDCPLLPIILIPSPEFPIGLSRAILESLFCCADPSIIVIPSKAFSPVPGYVITLWFDPSIIVIPSKASSPVPGYVFTMKPDVFSPLADPDPPSSSDPSSFRVPGVAFVPVPGLKF